MASTASASGLVSLRLRAIACTSVVRSFINIRIRVYGDDFRDTSYIASWISWLRAAGATPRTWAGARRRGRGLGRDGAERRLGREGATRRPGRGAGATPGAWNSGVSDARCVRWEREAWGSPLRREA